MNLQMQRGHHLVRVRRTDRATKAPDVTRNLVDFIKKRNFLNTNARQMIVISSESPFSTDSEYT